LRRRGQLSRAEAQCACAVLRLVAAHGGDDGARALIRGRQRVEMSAEMLLDLPFGLGEECKVPAVAERTGERADRERARIPERIEQARASAELPDALGAPGEMVLLFPCGLLERRP